MLRRIVLGSASLLITMGCSSDSDSTIGTGGKSNVGGSSSTVTGGTNATSTGGSHAGGTATGGALIGGTSNTGGAAAGGVTSFGGSQATVGGTESVGGLTSTGGATATTGGMSAFGGNSASGGASTAGGVASSTTVPSTGGAIAVGGTSATSSTEASGGSPATGGSATTGGLSATGGSPAGGGTTTAGGTSSTGGTFEAGGSVATGGSIAIGGSIATGGTAEVGGTSATGGDTSTGGATTAGGTSTTGSSVAIGGSSDTGGTSGTGGTTAGACVEGTSDCKDYTTLRTCTGGSWVESTCGSFQVCGAGACHDGCPGLVVPAGASEVCIMPVDPYGSYHSAPRTSYGLSTDPVGLPVDSIPGAAFDSLDASSMSNAICATVDSDAGNLFWYTGENTRWDGRLYLRAWMELSAYVSKYGALPHGITLSVKMRKIANPQAAVPDPWFYLDNRNGTVTNGEDDAAQLTPTEQWGVYNRDFSSDEIQAMVSDGTNNLLELDFVGAYPSTPPENVEVAWFALTFVPPS